MVNGRFMAQCLAIGWALSTAAALAQPSGVRGYELIEIRPLPGHSTTWASGLDGFARVVGRSGSTPSTPIVWINGQNIVVPTPKGYTLTQVVGIGSGGVVTGNAHPPGSPDRQPLVWTVSRQVIPLDLLPGTTSGLARAVDDRQWPATFGGGYCTPFSPDYATTWTGTSVTQIGPARSGVNDVNNRGEAVGSAENEFQVPRPVLWRDGQMIDIGGEPRSTDGIARGVNDYTEVVGSMTTRRKAFHWHDGRYSELPPISPQCGNVAQRAIAINDRGVIVGEAPSADCSRFMAAVWDRRQAFQGYLLSDLTLRHSDVRLFTAQDVNNAGQIAAFGEYTNGAGRGFLVTPYLFEMSDPVPGRAGAVNTITVTGLQPDQRVHLIWGTQEGAQKIRPACPGGTLLIRDPQALPAVRADANGVATITLNVPLIARGRTVRLQAVAPVECEISHTVTWTFE